LLNVTSRTHWSALGRQKKRMAWDVRVLTHGVRPAAPFAKAYVRIERHSSGTPDYDGLVGGYKLLIDCLLPEGKPYRSKKTGRLVFPHPGGLAIIADDNPGVMRLEPVAIKTKRGMAQTVVIVREMA
jgi:hypothetical protein